MAPPRKAAAARGRTRRRVKKNIAIGQAHIKTSFNNTIVSLTDKDGNVIAWESAGSAGFKGSRKSTPFAAQVTADSAARKGMARRLAYTRRFAVNRVACATFSRSWIPAPRFRAKGRYVVTLRAQDKSRALSRIVSRSLVRR